VQSRSPISSPTTSEGTRVKFLSSPGSQSPGTVEATRVMYGSAGFAVKAQRRADKVAKFDLDRDDAEKESYESVPIGRAKTRSRA
jgi:hypothetical protein